MNELSKEARALIDAARPAELPPPAAKTRVHAAVLASLAGASAASLPTSVHGATAGASKGMALAAKMGTGKVLGSLLAVVLAGTALWQTHREPPRVESAPTPLSEPPAVAHPEAPTAAPVATASAAAPVHRESPRAAEKRAAEPAQAPAAWAIEPAPSPALAASEPVGELGAPPSPACGVAEELGLLRTAQGELQAHNPSRALELLDQHAIACPDGTFREEERAARILSLCDLGRFEEAIEEATRFRAESPRSPQLDRIRASCAGGP